jgi:LmbE family N-acetylglucosaminyl deacetylase
MNTRNAKLTLMAVHAHPDDESIGTGGILAKYAAEGVKTTLVFGTRGEAGEILNPEFVPPEPGMSIKDIRARELEKALNVLQVQSTYFLEYRDSGINTSPEHHHPNAFAHADLDEATSRLVDIIRQVRPHVMVTYNENGSYGHPDHIMANRVSLRAFDAAGNPDYTGCQGLDPWQPSKLYYTAIPLARLRLFHQMALAHGEDPGFDPEVLGTPEEELTSIIDVRDYLAQKIEALFSHQSQIGPDSFFRRVPEELREEAFGLEYFVCVRGCMPSDRKEEDLFEKL